MRAENEDGTDQCWSRRELGRVILGATLAASVGLPGASTRAAEADASLLGELWRTLSPTQRQALVWPFVDPKRTMVQNHWAVVPSTIANLTAPQQDLALGLIRQVCTTAGFVRLMRQRDDEVGGWKHDHIAIFGTPEDPERFEWVLTGRHLTLRGSAQGAITAGPLFWGHSAVGDTNIAHEQLECARALFRSLNPEQRERAFVESGAVGSKNSGLALGELAPTQTALVRRLMSSLGEPYRRFNVAPIQACLDGHASYPAVRWQVFPSGESHAVDLPQIWRLVGPGFRWSFHADPHLHSWFESV